ncbi:hypothetical protein EYZ11_004641 [Aspergillus tanneri]|uniref:Uncharacterized protein n=1 Tax=Aspergillus tanneri TaxID=1220188 RepID=A0A4S3JK71_9EURO|nr:hypothetical protein EYZ11_004641 [Aspergillus tanneri]
MQFPWEYGTGLKLARDPESRPNDMQCGPG